jgi:valyl-tRNA synthetase
MELIMQITSGIRNCRAQWGIKTHQTSDVYITSRNPKLLSQLKNIGYIFQTLIKIRSIFFINDIKNTQNTASGAVGEIKYFIPLDQIIDVEKEKQRIIKEIEKLKTSTNEINKRLKNKTFLERASTNVVEKDKQRLKEFKLKIETLSDIIKNLK